MIHVALIRGINVGRAKQVAMADLRAVVESLGYEDVRTLLRSGNVVFGTTERDPDAIAAAIEHRITERLGMTARVVVRSADELATAVEANPIPEAAEDGSNLHVMFLAGPIPEAQRAAVEAADFGSDDVRVAERELYVWYRNGMSGSDTAQRLGKLVKAVATDRNWNTVLKLLAMARE